MLNFVQKRLLHIGQKIPQMTLTMVSGSPARYNIERDIDSLSYFSNKKLVLIGFPGAFTPTCTNGHIPDFVKLHDRFKERGFDLIGLSMNDPFVLKEFGEELQASFPFICDGTGNFTRALEAECDLTGHSLGLRTRRFTAVVDNGTIIMVNDEKGGVLTDVSKAETVLSTLNT